MMQKVTLAAQWIKVNQQNTSNGQISQKSPNQRPEFWWTLSCQSLFFAFSNSLRLGQSCTPWLRDYSKTHCNLTKYWLKSVILNTDLTAKSTDQISITSFPKMSKSYEGKALILSINSNFQMVANWSNFQGSHSKIRIKNHHFFRSWDS